MGSVCMGYVPFVVQGVLEGLWWGFWGVFSIARYFFRELGGIEMSLIVGGVV